jgi:hypothetical protein
MRKTEKTVYDEYRIVDDIAATLLVNGSEHQEYPKGD